MYQKKKNRCPIRTQWSKKTMSDEIDFEFDTATFDELRETLEKVAKKYPDYAEKELKKEGREFSKAVRLSLIHI